MIGSLSRDEGVYVWSSVSVLTAKFSLSQTFFATRLHYRQPRTEACWAQDSTVGSGFYRLNRWSGRRFVICIYESEISETLSVYILWCLHGVEQRAELRTELQIILPSVGSIRLYAADCYLWGKNMFGRRVKFYKTTTRVLQNEGFDCIYAVSFCGFRRKYHMRFILVMECRD